jgi:hypothetical protein
MMSAPSAVGTPDGRSSALRMVDDGNAGDVAGGAGCTVSVNVVEAAPALVGVAKLKAPEVMVLVGGSCNVTGAFVAALIDVVADDGSALGSGCVLTLDPQCVKAIAPATIVAMRVCNKAKCFKRSIILNYSLEQSRRSGAKYLELYKYIFSLRHWTEVSSGFR